MAPEAQGEPLWAERERLWLAPYAMASAASAGRRYPEPLHAYRGPFQRDRDRIVHSAAYRRLSAKTQVFTGQKGDYHRTRLTHTLEVSTVARTLSRALRLNEDLVEALSFAHDLGHPPFGHAGEDALAACLARHGGFSHNRHALAILEELEQRYPEHPGLNLSVEVLQGQAHRVDKTAGQGSPLLEVQVVDAADSVAYDTHDADDALELGLLTVDELMTVPLWRDTTRRVKQRYAGLSGKPLVRAVLHAMLDGQVSSLVENTRRRIDELGLKSPAEVRRAPILVEPSAELREQKTELEAFLFERVYRHPDVLHSRAQAQEMLKTMFAGYCGRPDHMPESFQKRGAMVGLQRSVGDYLAGMTDRYAYQEYARLFERPPH